MRKSFGFKQHSSRCLVLSCSCAPFSTSGCFSSALSDREYKVIRAATSVFSENMFARTWRLWHVGLSRFDCFMARHCSLKSNDSCRHDMACKFGKIRWNKYFPLIHLPLAVQKIIYRIWYHIIIYKHMMPDVWGTSFNFRQRVPSNTKSIENVKRCRANLFGVDRSFYCGGAGNDNNKHLKTRRTTLTKADAVARMGWMDWPG